MYSRVCHVRVRVGVRFALRLRLAVGVSHGDKTTKASRVRVTIKRAGGGLISTRSCMQGRVVRHAV